MSCSTSADDGQPLRLSFEDRGDSTLVTVRVTEFRGAAPAADRGRVDVGLHPGAGVAEVWLEHGIEGEPMYDKFPDATHADR